MTTDALSRLSVDHDEDAEVIQAWRAEAEHRDPATLTEGERIALDYLRKLAPVSESEQRLMDGDR